MNIEDVKIEDAADANYIIRKYFNDQCAKLKMSQLEQLVLTVYNMGKNSRAPAASRDTDRPDISAAAPAKVNPNPFEISDRVKAIEDIEIGHSGEIIKADTVGTVSSIEEDKVSFLFESGEDGEMIETSVLFHKLKKIT